MVERVTSIFTSMEFVRLRAQPSTGLSRRHLWLPSTFSAEKSFALALIWSQAHYPVLLFIIPSEAKPSGHRRGGSEWKTNPSSAERKMNTSALQLSVPT